MYITSTQMFIEEETNKQTLKVPMNSFKFKFKFKLLNLILIINKLLISLCEIFARVLEGSILLSRTSP